MSSKVNYMTITQLLSEDVKIFFEDDDDECFNEAKEVTPLDYDREWHEFPKNERHYSKKTGNRLYGCWIYKHREAAGAKYGDGKVVHHKNHNKHDNSKSNLSKISRAEHCIVDPNAKKHEGCKIKGCKNPHYASGYCQAHYMRFVYRRGKKGNYDKSKNYSKDER